MVADQVQRCNSTTPLQVPVFPAWAIRPPPWQAQLRARTAAGSENKLTGIDSVMGEKLLENPHAPAILPEAAASAKY
ncbi:hypothetical protein SBA2_840008 [Acidobacteriia bacterium SbA2]|nr:hypothetical protein SBA2_840008 [Acidobacteriia bacterium SbA2]